MASNNNKKNNNNNVNQPRRKRNKKPVKRYSEEYSNRPNPYTGYSADGNYHPDAKKHPTDEASVASSMKIKTADTQTEEIKSETIDAEQSEIDAAAAKEAVEVKVSRRKKNIDREAEKQAQQAKNEARKAAVDQIAKGVAAHSVSEQIIEDIASMTDAIESMAKSEKSVEDTSSADEGITENTKSVGSEFEAEGVSESESTEDEQVEIAPPIELGEDDVLPFDMPSDEISDKTEEQQVPEISAEPQKEEESQEETSAIPPLNPADLIPVLDFDKPPAPVLNFSEASAPESNEEDDYISELVNTATIEEILNAVEQENLASAQKNETGSQSGDFAFGSDVIFDTSKSDEWDNVIIPPADEDDAQEEAFDTSDEALSKLLDACFNSDDETVDFADEESEDIFEIADDEGSAAAEAISEVISESIFDLTNETREDISDITDEIFSTDETSTENLIDSHDVSDFVDDAEGELSDINEGTEDISVDNPVFTENEYAVNEKLQKIVEAAELAEIFRLENEEAEELIDSTENHQESENDFHVDLDDSERADSKNTEIEDSAETDDSLGSSEEIKEYSPAKKKTSQEDVFESVLIVDEAAAPSEEELEAQDDTLFLRAKGASECPTAVFKLPEGPIVLPTDIDDGDFQEQWLDEDEDGDEMASRSKRARRRLSAFIGAVSILFVLIGVGWVLKTTLTGFNNIGSTGEKKAEYTEFIAPVVINDPAPFENVEDADNQMLLESAIWSVLDSDDNESGYDYDYDATGKIILPGKEVAEAGKRLFGNHVKLNMDVLSESDGSVLYYYDSIEDKFHISTGGIEGPSAIITKIASKSDYVSLIVGYCSQNAMTADSSDTVEAYKYMEYILAFNDDGSYYIQSIRDYIES